MNIVKTKVAQFSLVAALVLFAAHCGDPVPAEKLTTAKTKITRAQAVKAELYAPEQYAEARILLLKSHDKISEGKMKDAATAASDASQKADEAYNIALPKLAEATRSEAEQAIRDAEDTNAEDFAPAEYESAQTAMTEGNGFYEKQDYLTAYHSFEDAREKANEARDISEAQAETMMRRLATIESQIEEAEEVGAADYSPDALNEAKKWAAIASQNIDELHLKTAQEALDNAEANAERALNNSLSDYARSRYSEAEQKVAEAEAKLNRSLEGTDSDAFQSALSDDPDARTSIDEARETLAAAKEALQESDTQYNNEDYRRSYDYADEALRLATILDEMLPETELLVADVKKRADMSGTDDTQDGDWKTYKVRLIPERRDCLWRIAEYDFIYDNARLWPQIYKANKEQIKNPDLIFPGQVFKIPPKLN